MKGSVADDADRLEGSEIDAALDELASTPPDPLDSSSDDKKQPSSGAKPKPDLTSLIASKISELEMETNKDEEEEREIARAVKAEHRKLSTLVSETDTEIGKVTLLQRKYTSLFQDMQRLERQHARQKAKSEKATKEFGATKIELSKAVNMKHKLETLCRELQKENKRVKEDSKRLTQSEQQKRVELNNKFETTIFEIKTKMDEESSLVGKRRLEDTDMNEKFGQALKQFELRETSLLKALRMKELEAQLSETHLEQFKRASESNEMRAKTLHSQVSTFSETESELRSQLNIYVDKFKQVEDTLNNSNDLFLNFRKEMESMTKKTKKLEKENALIRSKCDTANKSILEMAEERAKYRKEIEIQKQKSMKLENLCRALHRERKAPLNVANGAMNGAHASDKTDGHTASGEPTTETLAVRDERSDGSVGDDYSEASFEVDSDDHPPVVPSMMDGAQGNQIAGFLKVSDTEEQMIRQKRREYGRPTHSSPDRDSDGYLAVSRLEKDFISAVRDSSMSKAKASSVTPASMPKLGAELQKLQESFLINSARNSSARTELSEAETRLCRAAAKYLASLPDLLPTAHRSVPAIMPQIALDPESRTSDRAELLMEVFNEHLASVKYEDFYKFFSEMLNICSNSASLVPNRETYDALLTAAAILLPDGDIASLKKLYAQVKQGL